MATWYWQGDEPTSEWAKFRFTDTYEASGTRPAETPWTTSATKDDDIALGENGAYSSVIADEIGNGFEITGVCSIKFDNQAAIHSGTFTAAESVNNGTINNGTFTGDLLANYGGIYNGIFTGLAMHNVGGLIGGVFLNGTVSNSATIIGGVFLVTNFVTTGQVNGGLIVATNFDNTGYVQFAVLSATTIVNVGTIDNALWFEKGWLVVDGVLFRAKGTANPLSSWMPSFSTGDILGAGLL